MITYTYDDPIVLKLNWCDIFRMFSALDSAEQAMFFNELGDSSWLCEQLQMICKSDELKNSGRYAMRVIGEYEKENLSD
jgi:hypothetical protein